MPIAKEKSRVTRASDLNVSAKGGPESRRGLARRPRNDGRRRRAPERDVKNLNPRGYTKISDAANSFRYDFNNKVVLDIGSSTGGFTQYALDHGAKKVIAVEKGTNQMLSPLRYDPRVELHEKTDIFNVVGSNGNGLFAVAVCSAEHKDLARAARSVSEGHAATANSPLIGYPDVIMTDVSFVSLRKILKYAKSYLAKGGTDFLVMLKPQFEATPNQLHNGVVKNETIRREIIKDFEQWLKNNNFLIIKKHDNDLKGKTGNRERFYYLKLAK